jgi:hypothetical protein
MPMTTHRKRNIALSLIIVVAIILIVINFALEGWVKNEVNKRINALDGYSGQISDVDIHLWRGAYQIDDLVLLKTKGGLKEHFLEIKKIDLSIQWRALFNGKIVSEVDLYKPDVKFAKAQTGADSDWLGLLNSLVPFDINRFDIHDGKISYIDWSANPNVNIYIKNLYSNITNISNVVNKEQTLPSNIKITGTSIGGGKLSIDGKMNALTKIPNFDLALKLENADLTQFNDYFAEYAALNFKKGTISIYGEAAALKGKIVGYVKPIATDIEFDSLKKDNNILKTVWKSIASTFVALFENHRKDQFALRIPFEGQLKEPTQNVWAGFWSIFSNAFNQAFKKNVDGTINLNDVMEEN